MNCYVYVLGSERGRKKACLNIELGTRRRQEADQAAFRRSVIGDNTASVKEVLDRVRDRVADGVRAF